MSEAIDPVPSAPDSLTALAEGRKRRKLKVALALALALPVVGGAVLALLKMNEARADREIDDAWRRAAGCLLGAPLDAGQGKPSVRFRRIQLEAVRTETDPNQPMWPDRCADAVANVNTVLRHYDRTDGSAGELAEQADKLALALRKAGQLSDLSGPVDAFFEAGSRNKLDAKAVAAPAEPVPQPKDAFDVDSLPRTALIAPLQYAIESVSTTTLPGPELHVLLYDVRIDPKPVLCTFGPAGPETRCRKLGGELVAKPALAIDGTTDPGALPLVLLGQRGAEGIFRADTGERIAMAEMTSGYVAKDGYAAVAGRVDPETGAFELAQQRAPGAKLERHTIEPKQLEPKAAQLHRINVLWNKLVVQTISDEAANPPRLQYLELPAANPGEPFKDIGVADYIDAPVFACRSGEMLAVRIGGDRGFLAFFNEARWSKPLATNAFHGDSMVCDGVEAVMDSYGTSQQRCTSAGCKDVEAATHKLGAFKPERSQTAALGGKQLYVAATDGGLRAQWGTAEHQLLFDDHVRDGAVQSESSLLGFRLFGRGRFAVLLLTTPAGVFATYFDANGKPWPAKIAWAE